MVVVLLVATGCLTSEQAYRSINWKVIFLLAGIIPLGTAMQQSGLAIATAEQMVALLGDLGPRAVLSGFFLLTLLITGVINNQATAALMVPIAIETAGHMDVSSRPLLFAVAFAASLSFITPVGYQTNTMIYGPGQYRFSDFARVGLPLDIVFWLLATLLIPLFWSF